MTLEASSRRCRRNERKFASLMPSGLLDVMPPSVVDSHTHRLVHFSHDLTGHPQDQRAGRDFRPFDQDRSGPDYRASSDSDTVQKDCSHADQALVLDDAAVEDDPVPHRDPAADDAGDAWIGVDHRDILDVRLVANLDPVGVAPEDGVVPDARVVPQMDMTEDDGTRGDEGRWVNHAISLCMCRQGIEPGGPIITTRADCGFRGTSASPIITDARHVHVW
jgi:hypothetical protein